MHYLEILLRLTASVLIGGLIGLDRNLRGKPSGIRTLGLVSLGACLLTMIGMNALIADGRADPGSLSRVIQGLITGIGFLGAGVIVHENGSDRIRGLTTAASIWITAILGILCGMGSWEIAGIALAFVFLLFVLGKPIERALHRRWLKKPAAEQQEISLHDE
ncbi:MgtC/SapB family protein [Massilia sp. Root335]|uniref:MgtC/SapB family protein n=1 Tax=Massilia sp. Root335 TaxID=1736517 RepID=UPI0007011A3F|nr:MgtC/SapB family protein [Massilia sp. Root335]KQV45113.1 magnesium transporter [Massilia sp. Root335]